MTYMQVARATLSDETGRPTLILTMAQASKILMHCLPVMIIGPVLPSQSSNAAVRQQGVVQCSFSNGTQLTRKGDMLAKVAGELGQARFDML